MTTRHGGLPQKTDRFMQQYGQNKQEHQMQDEGHTLHKCYKASLGEEALTTML
jgi:hypothetical protein